MFGRRKALSQEFRAIRRGLAAVVLAAGVGMFLMLTTGMAEACPPGKDASASVKVLHQAKRAVAMTAAVMPASAQAIPATSGQCCAGAPHSHHAVGCASPCCFACSAATEALDCSLALPDGSTRHRLSDDGRAVSTKPPPDFRPPRLFA